MKPPSPPEPPARPPGAAPPVDPVALLAEIRRWSSELGFADIGVASLDLAADEAYLTEWLTAGFNGEMHYMGRHGSKRSRPAELIPGTVSCLSVRMNYWPGDAADAGATLADSHLGYVSRYAVGRDYHKVLRQRLQRLCDRITAAIGPFGYRVFTDSAPVLEKPLARNAGLGWIGKHTNLIDRGSGSYFFLGEIYLDIHLPAAAPSSAHCGTCSACISACPTAAIVGPFKLDARRCLSYLSIELDGAIPVEFRKALGNRIYGCDDCQLVCPWNKFAQLTVQPDFAVRHRLDRSGLVELFAWDETQFLVKTEGSAIRRIGFERWSRNIAVALGNAAGAPEIIAALRSRADDPSPVVREHVAWALAQHDSEAVDQMHP